MLVEPLQWSRGCEAAEASVQRRGPATGRPFNGAAAAKPRKPRLTSSRSTPRRSFNGAAAAKPRKHAETDVFCSALLLQWSRGCEAAEAYPGENHVFDRIISLQWSRGCEAAEASMSHARRMADSFLQWSRGCEAAEATFPFALDAQVGNLQWSRGCEAAEARGGRPDRHGDGPSMEPRLRSRGSLPCRQCGGPTSRLQWSRGCEAAEAPRVVAC